MGDQLICNSNVPFFYFDQYKKHRLYVQNGYVSVLILKFTGNFYLGISDIYQNGQNHFGQKSLSDLPLDYSFNSINLSFEINCKS